MSVIGTLLVLGAALSLSGGYAKFIRGRLAELEAFLSFIRYLEERIEGYLEPVSVAAGRYRGVLPAGLLDLLRAGASPREAYSKARGRLTVCSRAEAVLFSLFETLGEGKAEQELRHIRDALGEVNAIYAEEREASQKSIRVAQALILAGALGICILVI